MAMAVSSRATWTGRDLIRRAMNAPLLTREREFALAKAWREDADEDALHELVESYTRLVVSIATRFRHYGLPLGDLTQEGAVGLLEAAMRFDPGREVRFSTYASWWIRAAMQDYVLRNWSIVRTGTTAAQKSLFFNFRRLRARIEEETGKPLDHVGRETIAETLTVGLGEVESMEWRLGASDQSLNAPLGEDGDEDWQSLLADDRPSPEQTVIGYRDADTRSRWIAEALGSLSEREQIIIRARRLEEQGATLEELGRSLGVSKERVRQLESRALGKLRDLMLERVDRPADLLVEA